MLANLARGAFLVILTMMIVAYAVSVSSSTPAPPSVPTDRMYS